MMKNEHQIEMLDDILDILGVPKDEWFMGYQTVSYLIDRAEEADKRVDNLAALVRWLSAKVMRLDPSDGLPRTAIDYLCQHELADRGE